MHLPGVSLERAGSDDGVVKAAYPFELVAQAANQAAGILLCVIAWKRTSDPTRRRSGFEY